MGQTAKNTREQVRQRYAEAAMQVSQGAGGAASCCAPAAHDVQDIPERSAPAACCSPAHPAPDGLEFREFSDGAPYSETERGELPADAVLASLGCGNPVVVADLRPGERVLDLGSGGGIDVLLSARRVGPTGRAFGLDMTYEMLALSRSNADKAGASNVEFLKGTIESIPLPAASIDVVISNCVVNLSVDKPAVFAEMFRVLVPGGRIGITDVVAADHLSIQDRAERGSYVGCIAGALSRVEYVDGLTAVGFHNPTVEFTHQAVPGMHSAIIRATKPASAR